MTAGDAPCRLLPWDSDFFGLRIAEVADRALSEAAVERVLDWAKRESIDCLYYAAASDDADSVRVVQGRGFRLVDVRVTLLRRASGGERAASGSAREGIDFCKPEDVPALRAI